MTREAQRQTTEDMVLALNAKLDHLTAQLAELNAQLAALRQRQEAWQDLQEEVIPILREMFDVLSSELDDGSANVTMTDALRLGKQVWKNLPQLTSLLDQLVSLYDLTADLQPVTREAVAASIELLDRLERKGYFAFFREALRIVDNIVTNFTPEDVKALADNIVLILNTVKELTQPDIMELLQALADTYREVQEDRDTLDVSALGLLRQMRDPHVRRGLALTMQMLRLISLQRPHEPSNGLAGFAEADRKEGEAA